MSWSLDLNCDLGERETEEGEADDVRIMQHISSANIACGGHAGSRRLMRASVRESMRNGVVIGAHPSFRDRLGFGRVPQALTSREIVALVEEQVMELAEIAKEEGGRVQHVKPHGALYHLASEQLEVGMAVLEAIGRLPFACSLMGLANSRLEGWAHQAGVPFLREFFADRNYREDGSLVPRGEADSMVENPLEAAHRVLEVLERGELVLAGGYRMPMKFDSVCIHSDTNPRGTRGSDSDCSEGTLIATVRGGEGCGREVPQGEESGGEERDRKEGEVWRRGIAGRSWYIAEFRRYLEQRGVSIAGPPSPGGR